MQHLQYCFNGILTLTIVIYELTKIIYKLIEHILFQKKKVDRAHTLLYKIINA